MKKSLLLIAVSSVLFGCTVYKTNPPASQAPAAVQSQATTALPEREEPPLTISETMHLCKLIHASPELGIGCDVRYVEGRPAMMVVFPNAGAMQELWTAMTNHVAAPFCFAAVTANREAFVFLGVKDPMQVRLFSCETGEWSEWFDDGSSGNNRY